MMLLITMAISVAYVASMATSLDWLDLEFWWELAALVTIMLLGHWQEMKAIGQAQNALAALAALLPDEADLVDGDSIRLVAASELHVGDVVLVRPGARTARRRLDRRGCRRCRRSMITGESKPVNRTVGGRVVAGTVSTDSSIRVRVDAIGDDTALAGIQRLVADAQASQSRAQALADRFAVLLFYVAVASAVVTFPVWWAIGDLDAAITNTVTVLVIACPHALGLAIPLVIAISTAVSAKAGILVKDRIALERMRSIGTVLFDKTGTLTKGAHVVTEVARTDEFDNDRVLGTAAAVEAESEHPFARAIVTAAGESDVPKGRTSGRSPGAALPPILRAPPTPSAGRRCCANVSSRSPSRSATPSPDGSSEAQPCFTSPTTLRSSVPWQLEDEIRPEARQAVAYPRQMGVHVAMITGDARQVAEVLPRTRIKPFPNSSNAA